MHAVDGALEVVEVVLHRGALRNGGQQVPEFAERPRANHVAIVVDERIRGRHLADEHAEVILPEVGHHLEQLTIAGERTKGLRGQQLVGQNARRLLRAPQRRAVRQ